MENYLVIKIRRESYDVEGIDNKTTVAELIEFLSQYDEDTIVALDNDNGYTFSGLNVSNYNGEFYEVEGEEE